MLWKRECGKENEEHQWDWDFEQRSEGRPYPGDFIVTVQLLSRVLLFATPWTAVHQAPLFFTISWSLLKLMSIESVMPSNHLILCRPLFLPPSIFPSIRVFSNESVFFASGGQSIGVSASASVLPMNIQDCFPLGWTDIVKNLFYQ